MTTEKDIIRFTNQIASTISLKNITKQEFFNDINKLKSGKITNSEYISKYPMLFDGNVAEFGKKAKGTKDYESKAIKSYKGSIRRNSNIQYYSQLKDKDYITFNNELRQEVVIKPQIMKKRKITKPSNKISSSIIKSKLNRSYKAVNQYKGYAKQEVKQLKQVWQIDFIKERNLIGRQEVLLRVNLDLYFMIERINGKIEYQIYEPDIWITFSSGFSQKKTLITLYYEVLQELKNYMKRCSQSKMKVRIKDVYTYVIRQGGI